VAEIGFALGSRRGGEPNFLLVEVFVFNGLGRINWVRVPIFFPAGNGSGGLGANLVWSRSNWGVARILVRLCRAGQRNLEFLGPARGQISFCLYAVMAGKVYFESM
jgi:hypothetical protein